MNSDDLLTGRFDTLLLLDKFDEACYRWLRKSVLISNKDT